MESSKCCVLLLSLMFIIKKVLLNARINSFYDLILLEKKHIDLQNENMIMKKRLDGFTSADSFSLRKTHIPQAVYSLLLADVLVKIRLFQLYVKNHHSKNNPS